MVVAVDHASLGSVKTIGLPVKFSDSPGKVAAGAPLFGQHTREVLGEHGYDTSEIDRMLAAGAIAGGSVAGGPRPGDPGNTE
jgi:crotonobetainyl-CoA:carnitine CoA-transferase CaiB-like acyl-CoA transferase